MGGLLEKVESVLDTGKLMNKNLTSQSRRHITIIEDDKALNDGIVLALKNTEFTFTQNYSLGEFCTGDPTDLIILDVNLPDGSGFDFLREYREASDTPVIILTAKDLETDEVTGLTLGADDYITKPFSLMVLRARIDKVLQKRQMFSGNSYSDDEYSFDVDRMEFLARGMSVELSKTEQKLLRAGQAFKHQDRREEAHLQF